MPRIRVANVNDIYEGEPKKFDVAGDSILLYKLSDKIYATGNVCPHEQCFLDENHNIHEDTIECTCHGSQFDIRTGKVLLPPAIEPLDTYRVEVEGDDIFIEK